VHLIGVEPVAGTLDMVRGAWERSGLAKEPTLRVRLLHGACDDKPGMAHSVNCDPGEESCEVSTTTAQDLGGEGVKVSCDLNITSYHSSPLKSSSPPT
jgi:hypothetical protein